MQNIGSFIGLFCKRDLQFKEPTNRNHPIALSRLYDHLCVCVCVCVHMRMRMYVNAYVRVRVCVWVHGEKETHKKRVRV